MVDSLRNAQESYDVLQFKADPVPIVCRDINGKENCLRSVKWR